MFCTVPSALAEVERRAMILSDNAKLKMTLRLFAVQQEGCRVTLGR
jgi:hypothetical protein